MIAEPVRGRLPDPSFWSLPGIEQARARLRGEVPRPPLSHLLGLRLTQVGAGSATMTMPASPWLQNFDGAVDVRMLLESALDLAVTTGAPAGHDVRTTALAVNVLRHSGVEGETFVARARTINSGSLYTLAEVQIEDATGRAVAHATGSCRIHPLEPPPPSPPSGMEQVQEPTYSTPDPYLRPLPGPLHRESLQEEDGLTIARRHLAGGIPIPIAVLLGAPLIEVDEGSVTWTMRASEWFCGLSRDVAPGVVAALAHCGLGAVVTVAPAGHRVGTLEQSVTLLRPVRPDGRELVCRGRVVHQADGLVVSTVEVSDADGQRVALGYQTSVIRKRHAAPSSTDTQRILATVLFTDIVGSTGHAGDLGDSRWRELLEEHHVIVRKQLAVFKGREVKTTGDGFLATFDSPGRAVQAARAIRDAVRRLGLEVRSGLHTGECEMSGSDVAGIVVHIASRVLDCAGAGEVLVTSTVRDLVTGSGLRFTDRGHQPLKGIEGDRQLFALAE